MELIKKIVFSGIQQVGIGVKDLKEAWAWYRRFFGVDVRIFEDEATANLMLPYTGGKPRKRHAALALNLQGGGGFEIWQYKDRKPEPPKRSIALGDLGIFSVKIKSKDVRATYDLFKEMGAEIPGGVLKDPQGNDIFFVKDLYGNYFQIVPGAGWFRNEKKLTGATYGAIIGVSDIERSEHFYADILGYDTVLYDEKGVFEDIASVPGGDKPLRRVLLQQSAGPLGIFSHIFGPSRIELVSTLQRKSNRIFQGRFWGDLGFIHLCFDVNGMEALREKCKEKGYPFTVDSQKARDNSSFDMGEASGYFSYIEDPDGTLIEFVETHKLPVIKRLGWYVNLKKRNPEKALPDWLLKALHFNRIRDKRKKRKST